jgi:hypothetical protein
VFTLAEEPLEVTTCGSGLVDSSLVWSGVVTGRTVVSPPGLIDLLLKARLGGEEATSVRIPGINELPRTWTQAAGGDEEAMSVLLLCVRLQAPFASEVVHCSVILGLWPRLGGRGLIPPWSLQAGALLVTSKGILGV